MHFVELPHLIDVRLDHEGLPAVTVVFDLTTDQIGATLHALRTIREARFANASMSTDEALALRELTSLVDEFADMSYAEATARIETTIARVGVLKDAVAEFGMGRHLEREGDMAAHPIAGALLPALEDLHAEALRAFFDANEASTTPRC
ncbi:hypothetical protein GKE82_13920 [Conexibacter sp. W3-3-2]|uniref:Uncharacterized protein n=1 Tax=Paraconexibacter algicola TaxID=2133960 RepID=A0A2T4UII0_9ACTN|nr:MULTISPECIES: hypothetical protein [Solirubrobacterales]MTD45353.1 hypothetical protein [Conexibacter sp. W3-3-2]PTL59043.1 hypothetical protein C7Y72_04975 [Paraconexibacter algicola]